ncbi:nucleotidyltransferase family protein [Shewanella gelidimarina]|uniref:nucleotidyltransferase family protein n=1 Tax=Shewanella gelidimarina TaxID=56813 RepID=UPI00200C820A|nr:nucleotidyltransferase family protein [Shewanella gelidimarina]MCL1057761.1 nucleotidyltransferase family protein [Shewanella gelidimarina]
MIEPSQQIAQWLREDQYRYQALLMAEKLQLPQWMLAAGFVRNLVWDKLHETAPRPLNDIDLIYFDASNLCASQDREYEEQLRALAPDYPWSVKNQARMHLKNNDQAYTSCFDAMSFWPEKETAIAVTINRTMAENRVVSVASLPLALQIVTPFGSQRLFQLTLTHNPKKSKQLFQHRVNNKHWLQDYPLLQVISE